MMNSKNKRKVGFLSLLGGCSLVLACSATMALNVNSAKAATETEPAVEFASLTSLGASVRIATDVTSTDSGIRFGMSLSQDEYTEYTTGNYTAGIAVVFTDYEKNYGDLFNMETKTVSTKYFTGEGVQSAEHLRYWDFGVSLSAGTDEYAGKYIGSAAITGIQTTNLTLERTSYVYIKDSAGNYVSVVKGDPRSMAYTAQLACEDSRVKEEHKPFLQSTYIENAGNTSYTVEHITLNDIGEEVNTVKETVEGAKIGATISEITAKDIAHYEVDSENAANKASSIVYANGNTVLKQYYKLKNYAITGAVAANEYDGANYHSVVATNVDTQKEYTLTVHNGVASGELTYGNYTARVNGYKDITEEFSVSGEGENVFAATPKTLEFAKQQFSAGYVEGATALKAYSATPTDDWIKGTLNGYEFLQAGGKSRELLYENFCETEYSVGAFVSYTRSLLDNWGTGFTQNSAARLAGVSIRSSVDDVIHISLSQDGGIRISSGNLTDSGRQSQFAYIDGTSGYWADKGMHNDKAFNNNSYINYGRGGIYMNVTRANGVLTVYADGIQFMTLDKTNGITLFGDFAGKTVVYKDATAWGEANLKADLATVLADGTGNYVGYNALQDDAAASNHNNTSSFVGCYRSNDPTYALSAEKKLLMLKNVYVNGKTISNTEDDNSTFKTYIGGVSGNSAGDMYGFNYVYATNTMKINKVGTNVNNKVYARYFNNLISGSFSYSAKLTFNAVNTHRGGLMITDGTNMIGVGLNKTDLWVHTIYPTTAANINACSIGTSATEVDFKVEFDVENTTINVYYKVPSQEDYVLAVTFNKTSGTNATTSTALSTTEHKNVMAAGGAILDSLAAGKNVVVGFGTFASGTNGANFQTTATNITVSKLA